MPYKLKFVYSCLQVNSSVCINALNVVFYSIFKTHQFMFNAKSS